MNSKFLTTTFFFLVFPLLLTAQNKTFYFDSNWNATTISNASFYRIAYYNSSGGFTGKIIDYYPDGTKQCVVQTDTYRLRCGSSPISCGMENGTSTWYNRNGTKSSWARIEDGKIIGSKEYSSYGSLLSSLGCVSGDCWSGYGTFYTSNGDRYNGYFNYGEFHGTGKYTWASSGKSYSGQFRDGQIYRTSSSSSGITVEDVKNGLDVAIKLSELYKMWTKE